MANWDADSPQLHQNLAKVRASMLRDAEKRVVPTVAVAKVWQKTMMAGLTVSDPLSVGRFRGEFGLQNCQVRIGRALGVPSTDVADELQLFETRLQAAVSALDQKYSVGVDLDTDGLAAVIDLAAWAHAEWVRIHPFANGNGRTARVWANLILVRYGIPPAVRLRPRPEGDYGAACARAMQGDWQPTALVFRVMVREATAPPVRAASSGRVKPR
jgi:hypothetical protein